jgi:hypothetical protein
MITLLENLIQKGEFNEKKMFGKFNGVLFIDGTDGLNFHTDHG